MFLLNNKEYLISLFESDKPLIIYKASKGYYIYTDFSDKQIVTKSNINTFIKKIYSQCKSRNKYFDGYIANPIFVDGLTLAPSSFAETNEDTGQWRPIKYAGTYGTNGFFLDFKDNSAATAAATSSLGTPGCGVILKQARISVSFG